MDHILKVGNPIYPDLKVPYLCEGWQYTAPFATYPVRRGFKWTDLLDPSRAKKPAEEVDQLLQSWLFFGLLQEIFGDLFNAAHYVRVDSKGSKILTTQRLRRTLVEYKARERTLSEGSKSEKRKQESNNLHLARLRSQERKENCRQQGVLQTLTEVAISALINFIAKNVGHVNETSLSQNFESGYIERYMVERRWCPRQIQYLSESLHIETLYMMSRNERPDPHLRHSDDCMVDCIGNQVDDATYKTKHVCEDGRCSFVSADPAKMYGILKAGHLPLVVNQDYSDQHDLEITDSHRNGTYVAISHVWSHGLGNAQRNALPRCQLQRICKIVRDLYGSESHPVPFWIDTICCPLTPKEARKLAIVSMRHTYSKAEAVIVLEANLEKLTSTSLWEPELAFHIASSTWTTRLWTLQEGALAKLIYLHFADGTISLESLHNALRTGDAWREFGDLLANVINLRQADYSDMDVPASGRIQFLHASVKGRSTSHQSDEALCLAPFAGLDVRKIAEAEGVEERMLEFWRQMKPTPSMMAFWRGRRLKTKGRRWAPATLRLHFQLQLDMRKAGDEERAQIAEQIDYITDEGILLKAPGLVFEHERLDSVLAGDGLLGVTEFSVAYPDRKLGFLIKGELLTGRPPGTVLAPPTDFRPRGHTTERRQYALILKRGRKVEAGSYEEKGIDSIGLLVKLRTGDSSKGTDVRLGTDPASVIAAEIVCNVPLEEIYPLYDDTMPPTGSEGGNDGGEAKDLPVLFSSDNDDEVVPTVAITALADEQAWRIG